MVALLSVALAACAGGSAKPFIADTPLQISSGEIAGEHDILVVTTRAKSTDPRIAFTGQRADHASFASVDVTVPAVHKIGALERPKNSKPDPRRYFTARSITGYPDSAAFETKLRQTIRERGGRALIFIHGYNTPFDAAVYRATQIVHDANYAGAPILFTWASGGREIDYVYDRDSALAARDALEGAMRLAVKAGATRVDVIAHSMGNMLTMEVFRQLAMTNDRDLDGRLGDVVLASPDIDVDVFKSQMRRYGKPAHPFFVLMSKDDRALLASRFIAGDRPRLGAYADDPELASLGLIIVDLSGAKAGDGMNHAKFADNPILVKLLGERLNDPTGLGATDADLNAQLANISSGLGKGVGSAVELVITTPFEILRVATGG